MRKFFKCIISVALAATAALSAVFCGCSFVGNKTASTDDGEEILSGGDDVIISYVSSQSQVFSSTAEVVDEVADTVVEIQTESVTTQWGHQYIVSGAGSGVIIGKRGDVYYIVTNNHVIDGAREITVTTRSGVSYEAALVATDDSADIAVITVSSQTTLDIAVWGNSDQLKIGEDVLAIGNPMGSLGGTVTKGIISAKGRSITVGDYAMTLLQTDTAINPGNSGGGLFNMRGELIGVVNAKTTSEEIEGICFAIPANRAKEVVNDLVAYGYINGRAALGLTLSEGTLSSGGISSQTQTIVYVTAVGSVPENTFRIYDRIYSINGKTLSSILDYNVVMSQIAAGDTIEVSVYRGKVTQGFFGNNITFESDLTTFSVKTVQYGA